MGQVPCQRAVIASLVQGRMSVTRQRMSVACKSRASRVPVAQMSCKSHVSRARVQTHAGHVQITCKFICSFVCDLCVHGHIFFVRWDKEKKGYSKSHSNSTRRPARHVSHQRLFFYRSGVGRGCGVGPLGPSPTHGRPSPAAVKYAVSGGRTNFNPPI